MAIFQTAVVTESTTKKHICAATETLSQTYGSHSVCCGNSAYNRTSHLCCNGRVQAKQYGTNGWDSGCCGNSVINHHYYSCCSGMCYRRSSKICCKGTIMDCVHGWNSRCCDSATYEHTKSICCKGYLYCKNLSDYGNTYCCGTQAYQN